MNPDVLDDIALERSRQDELWGEQNHDPATWLAILTEEVGEAAQEVLRRRGGAHPADLETEVIHVAAVAIQWLEAIKREGI